MGIEWGLTGAVILTGLVLVFTVLVVLILMVQITSRIVGNISKEQGSSAAKPAEMPKAAAVTPAAKPSVAIAQKAPVIESGIDGETVAVISAAVHSCMSAVSQESGAGYAIQSIKRAAGSRPVWGFAGMQQNTRPF